MSPHEGTFNSAARTELSSRAGIAKRAPESGLWSRPSTEQEDRVWLSTVLILVLQGLVESPLLVAPDMLSFLRLLGGLGLAYPGMVLSPLMAVSETLLPWRVYLLGWGKGRLTDEN